MLTVLGLPVCQKIQSGEMGGNHCSVTSMLKSILALTSPNAVPGWWLLEWQPNTSAVMMTTLLIFCKWLVKLNSVGRGPTFFSRAYFGLEKRDDYDQVAMWSRLAGVGVRDESVFTDRAPKGVGQTQYYLQVYASSNPKGEGVLTPPLDLSDYRPFWTLLNGVDLCCFGSPTAEFMQSKGCEIEMADLT